MTKILAVIGVIAILAGGLYYFSESQKSPAEKVGDKIEDVGDAVKDAVEDPGAR